VQILGLRRGRLQIRGLRVVAQSPGLGNEKTKGAPDDFRLPLVVKYLDFYLDFAAAPYSALDIFAFDLFDL
jgi:hypothetical protein